MGISALLASQILDASATGRSVITGADASAIRTTLGLGTLATQSPTGTPSASTFLRGDFSWQTIDLSGYVPYSGATGAVNLGANALTASRATLATGTITASTPALNVTQTWNNAATTFTGILANVTDTASNAASLLLDLQVGGSSKFKVDKKGTIISATGTVPSSGGVGSEGLSLQLIYSNYGFGVDGIGRPVVVVNSSQEQRLGLNTAIGSTGSYGWSSSAQANQNASFDLTLFRDTSDTLAQRRSTNSQTFRLYGTYTDASNYERAKIAWESNVLRIGTEKAGTGSARALELQTDGTTRLTITTAGRVELGTIAASANAPLRIQVDGPGRGFVISNSATEYTEFVSGGVVKGLLGSGSVPFAVSNAGDIYFQCNSIEVLRCTSTGITASQNITLSTKNLVTDTTTGTKIGTATTQKLGFYNATPVVQPTAVADATDAASVITQLNALLSRMRNLGLIAT